MSDATELATTIVERFTNRTITLATCESITGGGIGATLTSVPGASTVYRGGLITYARELKVSLAGVDEELVEREGVVNELTALQMALGAQRACDSEWAIATTGVAGPSKADGQDVGTVWIAVVGPRIGVTQQQYTELCHFDGDRAEIREATTRRALEMLERVTGGE